MSCYVLSSVVTIKQNKHFESLVRSDSELNDDLYSKLRRDADDNNIFIFLGKELIHFFERHNNKKIQ